MKHWVHLTLLACLAGAVQAAGSAGVDPQTQAFLEALEKGGGAPMETLTPEQARGILTGAQQGAALPAAQVEQKTIQVEGESLGITVVKPKGAKGKLPVFMFFHGGGWVLGDFPTHERLIRDLVNYSGAAAVYVNYTPSPEAKFPTAVDQAYKATLWVAEHASSLGLDGSRLAVAGNSVGGNMAAVVALKAKEAGKPKLAFQLLLWPVTDANFNNQSYLTYADGHFLTRGMMEWFWNHYTTSAEERNSIYASPLRASLQQLQGLPPALIQTAEMDVLRDEGEAYGRRLNQAGVTTSVVRYNGMIHDYGLLNVLSQNTTVQLALQQAGTALQQHLAAK